MRAVSKKPLKRVRKYYNGGQNWPPELKARMLASGNWKEGPNGELLRVSAEEANQAALLQSRQAAAPEKYTPTEVGFMSDERREYLENLDRPLSREEAQEYATEAYNPSQPANVAFSTAAGFGTPAAALEDYLASRLLTIGKDAFKYLGAEAVTNAIPAINKAVKYGMDKIDQYVTPLPRAVDRWSNAETDVIDYKKVLDENLPEWLANKVMRSDLNPSLMPRWIDLQKKHTSLLSGYANSPEFRSIPEEIQKDIIYAMEGMDGGVTESLRSLIKENAEDLTPDQINALRRLTSDLEVIGKEARKYPNPNKVPHSTADDYLRKINLPPPGHGGTVGGSDMLYGTEKYQSDVWKRTMDVTRNQDDLYRRLSTLGQEFDDEILYGADGMSKINSELAMTRLPLGSGYGTSPFDDLIGGEPTLRARRILVKHSQGQTGPTIEKVSSRVTMDEWPTALKEFTVFRNQSQRLTPTRVIRNGEVVDVRSPDKYQVGDIVETLSQKELKDVSSVSPRSSRPVSTSLHAKLPRQTSRRTPGVGGEQLKLEIVIPEGTAVANPSQLGSMEIYPSEMEVLLHPDQKYIVESIEGGHVKLRAISHRQAYYTERGYPQSMTHSNGGRVVKRRRPGFAVVK